MATDWSARSSALEYFEGLLKVSRRLNTDDKEHYAQAVNALRRSQDHTAIQSKCNEQSATIAAQQAKIAELETTQLKFGNMQHEFMSRSEATIAAQQARIDEARTLIESLRRYIMPVYVKPVPEQSRYIVGWINAWLSTPPVGEKHDLE